MAPDAIPQHPKARDDVVFRQLDDEWVLFDPTTNQLHVLNLTAALVWSNLNGDMTAESITESVQTAFGSAPPGHQVARDVDKAISQFHADGLLE